MKTLKLENFDTGSSNPTLNRNHVHKIKVRFPSSLSTQRKVAAILSSYDDLIENNKRRIALLEKMAAEIYREWFVRMRFPGYQNSKFVKGVPEGWGVKPLSSISREVRKSVKKKDLNEDALYVGLEHLPRRSFALKENATAATIDSDKLQFQEGDILFCKIRPYLHKIVLAHHGGVCSTDTIIIRPKLQIYAGYLLLTVFSETFVELATVASKGTKMPRADWHFLCQLELAIPDEALMTRFQTIFRSIFEQIVLLLKGVRSLAAARDSLIPRLLSGRLRVDELEIGFPPTMKKFDE